ncbi:MAG: ATP-dependent DNA helicase [Actinomycetia bacterium]|nr:ATP-dependent DNA helicase [Actinomycetes bacterium]
MAGEHDPEADARRLLDELVESLPSGGETRDGQADMAALVAQALPTGGRLAVRAGTGTGKSLAVLAAVATTGVRTVIATATKALQDQYADKELPFVAAHRDLHWAVLKGRSNYLCLARLAEAQSVLAGEPPPGAQDELFETEPTPGTPADLSGASEDRLETITDWADSTVTGDLSELPFEIDRRTAPWVATGPDGCPGADKCAQGADCFAESAIAAAREAQVVLVNTALLGADLALEGALLGDAQAYVIDEAHEAEDILASAFGAELRGDDLLRVERNIRVAMGDTEDLRSSLRRTAAVVDTELGEHADEVFREGFPDSGGIAATIARAAGVAAEAQSAARDAVKADGDDPRAEAARRSADRLAEMIDRLAADGTDDAIWVGDPGPTMRRVPIDVGDRLQMTAWGDAAVVLTSATVSAPMMGRLGLGSRAEFEDVGSPFDHRDAAMLYVPPLLSSDPPRDRNPNHPEWMDEAWAEAAELIDAAQGRTLFLCTSMRNAREFAERARDELPWPVLLQGEMPKPKLLAEFADDEHTVAVGTMGLWQGVDVAGPSLSLVIVDKLPFPRPDDPLWQARADAARRRLVEAGTPESDAGFKAFLEVQVPRAASLLAQGTGRLIRTASDRGLVAVLDPRLAEKSYRKAILDELAPMRRTRTRSEAIAHLHEGLESA